MGYQQSDEAKKYKEELEKHQQTKPGDYSSEWQTKVDELYGQIQDQKPFQYDVNTDALYQQAVDQYIRQGQKAMTDTMGKATAMTGGYGNSYAQAVGQQTYQDYLQGLHDRLPEYAQLAKDRYDSQREGLLEQYSMALDREQQDRDRYDQAWEDYLREQNRLQGLYEDQRAFDYGVYRDELDDQRYDQEWAYQKEQDQLAYQQWQEEMAYKKEQDRISYEQWKAEMDLANKNNEDENEEDQTEEELKIDWDSINALGLGPINEDGLMELIDAGLVEYVVEDGEVIFILTQKGLDYSFGRDPWNTSLLLGGSSISRSSGSSSGGSSGGVKLPTGGGGASPWQKWVSQKK